MSPMPSNVFLIGIAGGSGSGKTTFARKVLRHSSSENISILHMDAYYLATQPAEHYTKAGNPNFDHPEAFDWELLRSHLLDLKRGLSIQCPVYDFSSSSRTEQTINLGPCRVVIFEGIFSLYDKNIRDLLDIKCFLHVDSDIRFTRRLHRDVKERSRSLESVISQYYDTVRPMYQKHLDPQKQYADFTVGEETDVASTILGARINEFLQLSKKVEKVHL